MTDRSDTSSPRVVASRRSQWLLPDDVTYLNHGSFGPSPQSVRDARQRWTEQLETQPMDFLVRQSEAALDEASQRLGEFIGARGEDLIFVENATVGMNIVAANVPLKLGDEVLCTDHEYGAVLRIWRHVCKAAGAKVVVRRLPARFESADAVVASLMKGVTARTRLIVVSHITSPTAAILPVETICKEARRKRVPVCVDGPHALAMLPLGLQHIGCDYYTASCHKWLSASFGSGFLFVAPKHQQKLNPSVVSWGRSISGRPTGWKDEFTWSGTRDPAAFLSVPAAVEFLESVGLDRFREETHALARYARHRIVELTGIDALVPDSDQWYGSMITLPLPPSMKNRAKPNEWDPLQRDLYERYQIEIPVITWHGRRHIRVSCHLYNSQADVDRLVDALRELLPQHCV